MVYDYKGYLIEPFNEGYTVDYCGDAIYFDSIEDAMEFIKGVE